MKLGIVRQRPDFISLQTSSLFHKSLRAQAITKIGAYETPYRLLNLPAKMVQ